MHRWICEFILFVMPWVDRIVLTLVKLGIHYTQAPILKLGMKEKYF